MPRDPSWMFCYWEVQPQALKVPFSHAVIKAFEFNDTPNSQQERFAFEISVPLESRNWYINVGELGRSWFVELGLVTPDGRFVLLARSNKIHLPSGKVSDVIDNRWAIYHDKLIELSRAEQVGHGSLEIARMLLHRWEMEMKLGISSWKGGKSERGGPSSSLSSWQKGAVSPAKVPPEGKK
jgi:hypothetical protein